ncbi:MAG TPA: bifunctional DNA-formamidopyrimidine glycosylase/DNA-(apurinic or apyrimidinic site) lyase [Myxococcales bacterium]|nr:bifunctional DNA-formamidopyrimidine glycosylase/DNA-(apurinic or apyrimidinic site) lyase [Myxococcales bacterium]
MPELPEVEIARRQLARWLDGRQVTGAEADRTRTFRGGHPQRFARLRGRLREAGRRGKYLLLQFDDGTGVLAHFGMTGKLVRRPHGVPEPYSRARFLLDDGTAIHFRDARMLGRIDAVDAAQLHALPEIRQLGVDPLADGMDWRALQEAVAPSRQDLKVALMDQGRIAGLGNIHAAEALFRSGLHPASRPGSLGDEDWKRLCRCIHQTIRFALAEEEGPTANPTDEIEYVEEPGAQNPFLIYGRKGERCRRCGAVVRAFTQGGRTTHFCPGCQRRPGGRHRRS